MVDIAQLVSVPGCGPGGRGFESHYSPHNAIALVLELIYRQKISHVAAIRSNLQNLCKIAVYFVAKRLI